jgi:hypothetical protein
MFRLFRGRSTMSIALMLVGATAVIAVSAFVVWDRNFRYASPVDPGLSCPTVVPPKGKPPLAAPGVHRVALIGDSIMWQASCSVADSLANAGIETGRFAVSGSGLLTGSVNWLTQTQQILQLQHPDVVVAIFVGNYVGPPITTASGQTVADNSLAFFAAWQQRAEQLSKEVQAAGAQMYWVSPPPIAVAPLNDAQVLFNGYRSIPGDHVLNSGNALAGPNGSTLLAKESCGQIQSLRFIDHVHLTDDGARIYGEQIAHDLTAQLGLLTTPKPC